MQQEHDQQQTADLCTNGCGFFGSQATGGMCSVCWKKTMSKNSNANNNISVQVQTSKNEEITISNEEEKNHIITTSIVEKEEIVETIEKEESDKKQIPIQKNRKRCMQCNKKVGLTGIECRCGFIYCGVHRYADQHECTFDYKTADRKELAKRNPGGGLFNKMDKL